MSNSGLYPHICCHEMVAVPATLTSEFPDSGNSTATCPDMSVRNDTLPEKLPASSVQLLVMSHKSEVCPIDISTPYGTRKWCF